jgi:8-oxo-dGTP pyrophosphatase MutT (NUDIX family)
VKDGERGSQDRLLRRPDRSPGQPPGPLRQRHRRQRRGRDPADPPLRQRQLGHPGGAIDLGESVAQAAIRETCEETGITCELTGLAGIYSDPRHVILYTSNGEVRQEFSIVLTARLVSGTPTPSDESTQVRWVRTSDLPGYPMDRSMRIRINDYLRGDPRPVVN